MRLKGVLACLGLAIAVTRPIRPWHDETHIGIARLAGYRRDYFAAAPDVAKIKAGNREERNHYYDNPAGEIPDAQLARAQIGRYNDPSDTHGHLYGAIIAAMRDYFAARKAGKFAEYHMGYALHYIGDLAMPLHNSPYDDFNKDRHRSIDHILEENFPEHEPAIRESMRSIILRPKEWETDLTRQIIILAGQSIELDKRLRHERRSLTVAEARLQIARAASLARAVLQLAEQKPAGTEAD